VARDIENMAWNFSLFNFIWLRVFGDGVKKWWLGELFL
jgi:hypothetical protein